MENLPELPPGFVVDNSKQLPELPQGFVLSGQEDKIPLSQIAKMIGTGDDAVAANLLRPKTYQDPDPGVETPQWGIDNPNLYGLYGAGKGVLEQAVTPAVEAGGMALGSLASPIVGTSLGYGIAKQVTDLAEDYYSQLGGEAPKQRTIPGEIGKSAVDTGMFLAAGKAFEMAAPTFEIASKYMFDTLPKQLYGSAVKLPLYKKWLNTMPGKDVSRRTLAVEEGLRSTVPPSDFGIAKAEQLQREVGKHIGDTLKVLSENPGSKIKVDDVLNTGLRRAYAEARASTDPKKAKAVVDKIKEGFKGHGEYLTPKEANRVKIRARKEVKWTEGADELTTTAKKDIAHDIMKRIETLYPEIKATNQTYEARRSLIEGLERFVGRDANKDMVGLGTKVLLTNPKTWPLAVWEATIGHPQIKARLAFLLAKGNPSKYSKFIYPDMPVGYVPPSQKIESVIYRYKPEHNFTKSTIPGPFKSIIREGETPKVVINRSKQLRITEESERLKHLENAFNEIERKKSLIGPPLRMPRQDFVKSNIPMSVEQRIKIINKPGLMGSK